MLNFWDFSVWAWINTFAVLLGSLLVGNMLKRSIPFLRDSLTPTSVVGGIILTTIESVCLIVTTLTY